MPLPDGTPTCARPWKAFQEGKFGGIINADGREIANVYEPAFVPVIAAVPEMIAELRRLEWVLPNVLEPGPARRYCPQCGELHPDNGGRGHSSDCTLASLLKTLKGFVL